MSLFWFECEGFVKKVGEHTESYGFFAVLVLCLSDLRLVGVHDLLESRRLYVISQCPVRGAELVLP